MTSKNGAEALASRPDIRFGEELLSIAPHRVTSHILLGGIGIGEI
jgi:hypothetical protein